MTPEAAEQLSQKEIIDFLFMPSFSMAKQISDISGRGVGLDVVKSNIEALGGDVEVRSKLGEGSKFIVRLPLTLAIIQALMVEIRDEKYAIALASIQTIEYISTSDIKYVESKEVIHIRGAVIPLIRMDQELDFEPVEDDENLTVVIVQKGDKTAGRETGYEINSTWNSGPCGCREDNIGRKPFMCLWCHRKGRKSGSRRCFSG